MNLADMFTIVWFFISGGIFIVSLDNQTPFLTIAWAINLVINVASVHFMVKRWNVQKVATSEDEK